MTGQRAKVLRIGEQIRAAVYVQDHA